MTSKKSTPKPPSNETISDEILHAVAEREETSPVDFDPRLDIDVVLGVEANVDAVLVRPVDHHLCNGLFEATLKVRWL